ncbi:hypothetical protein [Schlesneria paludicola]|uniref:hypothetical protein n=1 Tax=Schlesneria paludicola TaxID=360056 RepID=UPI00029AC806|nr:hypothetical protein [Schlesneria paludicola]
MPNGLINLAVGLAMQVGSPGPSEMPNAPVPARAYGQYGFEGSAEQHYASDSQMSWVHGYFQEIPAYGGHGVFRPYNYKDVLSQSQTAAGWGERPSMPYSQQFWHKYHDQATMLKVSRYQPAHVPYGYVQPVAQQHPSWVAQPTGLHVPAQQMAYPQVQQPAFQHTVTVPGNLPETLLPPTMPSTGELNQIQYRR